MRSTCAAWLALLAASVSATSLQAQDAETFFAGKTINLIVASTPGGGYDAYARTLERHFARHVPGKPSLTIQYIPGGGGMVAANTLFNLAKRDGTTLAMLASSSFLVGALGEPLAKFENAKFTNIGNMSEETDTCSVWHSTGVKDHRDFLTKPLIVGTAGIGSNSQTFPMAMNEVLNAKFKFVTGYQGSATLRTTAMESGELQATCGIFVSTLSSQLGGLLNDGKLKVMLQMGLSRHPKFPDVPNALELAPDEAGRSAFELLFAQLALGRPIMAPPGVPKEIARILAKAFADTMNDPAYLADAQRLKLETRWFGPERMDGIMAQMDQAPEPVKAKVRKMLNIAEPAR
jgi:tripartite-type tricarboxylate transporter receptor subunit TctC